jgi:hypothetical protein
METTPSASDDDYVPQDDLSEFQRFQKLNGVGDDGTGWADYDPAVHGDFDFDVKP